MNDEKAMDPDTARLIEIDRLFEAALEMEPKERALFLAEASRKDRALVNEVEELLGLAEGDDERLSPTKILTGPLWSELDERSELEGKSEDGETLKAKRIPGPGAGDRVGAYRILRELGRGGMAVVYLAERADGAFDQQVALKLLRPGVAANELLQRFEQERQILASLNHPAIARLLDGGVDDLGRPFIALEHVEGQTIDRYCDEHRLSVEERISLFLVVSQAVGYAHSKLVVHRDLKPSNILVDAEGQVKLLDFGIAKLLDPAVAGSFAAPDTRTMHRVLTPEYASPEQVRGDAVTTASDVYQLGLLLYELLTGTRAVRLAGLSATETERAICMDLPPRPSTLEISEEISRSRQSTPAQLAKRLRGDLDNILFMALRKEPDRRYATPAELISDLERYRTGLPVTARPDTLTYRTRKFVRRHRFGLAAILAIVVLGIGYAITITMSAAQISRERDRAQAEASKAREVKDFLVNIFEVSDPEEALGEKISARELLERGSARVHDELADQPEVQAEMLRAIGEIYRKLGLFDRAEPLLRQALELTGGGSPEDAPALTETLRLLGKTIQAKGANDEAEAFLRKALELRRSQEPVDEMAVAESLRDLSVVHSSRGENDLAEPLLREALQIYRDRFGSEREEVASTLDSLAPLLRRKGDSKAAEVLLREAHDIRRKLLPEDHPDYATSLSNLAMVLRGNGDLVEAESLFRQALGISEKVRGPDHPWGATIMNNLAGTLFQRGQYTEAEALLRRAFEIRQEALPENHTQLAWNLSDLGRVLQAQGKLEEAEAAYRDAIARYPPDHRWRTFAELNLALALKDRGELDEAERLVRSVLDQHRKESGDDHRSVAIDLLYLGQVLRAKQEAGEAKETGEAERVIRDAVERFRNLLADDHPRHADGLKELGHLLLEQGQTSEACPYLEEAASIRSKKLGEDDPRTEEALALSSRCRAGARRLGPEPK